MNRRAIVAEILATIPRELHDRSGDVPYSGTDSWSGRHPVYLLGLNPGGDPEQITGTVAESVRSLETCADRFSNYLTEWVAPGGGRVLAAGTHPHQRRVLHLHKVLDLAAGTVPASNLIFVRSKRESDIASQFECLAQACWPFHRAMLARLQAQVVVCFGGTVTGFVRSQLHAHSEVDSFTERNKRGWTSRTWTGPGPTVVGLTHPSIADWTNPDTDPTGLVVRAVASRTAANGGPYVPPRAHDHHDANLP